MNKAPSYTSSHLFESEYPKLSAMVQKRLELEWHYHQRSDLEPAGYHLFQYALEFGRLLKVVYRHQLTEALHEEAFWYAEVFDARGWGYDAFALLLDSWIIAIQGIIKPPECNELAQPLQQLRETLPSLFKKTRLKKGIEPFTTHSPLVKHLIQGDVDEARSIITSLINTNRTPDRIILEELLTAMAEIGQLWEFHKIEIFQEHLATETIRHLLAGFPFINQQSVHALGLTALVSCVPGDIHDLIPLALCTYLELRGWKAKNLGGSLPAEQIAHAVERLNPHALFLTLTMLSMLDNALEVVELTGKYTRDCRIVIGGHGATLSSHILEKHGILVARDFDHGYNLALGGKTHA